MQPRSVPPAAAGPRRMVLAAAGYLALVFALYGGVLQGAWCCDDTQILLHAWSHAPWRYFADPQAWQSLVAYSLTPWLSLSYRIDLALFGPWPAAFYAHQLVAIAACAWMLHLLLRERAGDAAAACAGVLFLVGIPVAQASRHLMVRHYVEGLFALLLCLWLVRRHSQRPLRGGPPAIALAFAVAASAKEVYLPLGLTALMVAGGHWRARLAATWPVFAVMLLYLPWRAVMLGDLVGGYTPASDPGALPGVALAAAAFAGLPALLWSRPAAAGALVLALAVIGWLACQGRSRWTLPAAHALVALLLAAPLLPLVHQPGLARGYERYLFAAWAALAAAVGTWLGAARSRSGPAVQLLGGLLVFTLALLSWQPARRELRELDAVHALHRAHFDVLTSERPQQALLASPEVVPWFSEGAIALRPRLGREAAAPALITDESQLPSVAERSDPLRQWDAASRQLVDAKAAANARLQAGNREVQPLPMQVAIAWHGPTGELRWQLGGAAGARYTLVSASPALPIPSERGALRYGKALPGCFRIRQDTSDGRIAYSPWLRIEMARHDRSRVDWQGTSESLDAVLAAPQCPAR